MRADYPRPRIAILVAWSLVLRVWLGVLLLLQVAAFGGMGSHAAEPTPPELAALGAVLGTSVAICHHGDSRAPGKPHDKGDCCACPLCCCAHQTVALVPAFSIEMDRCIVGGEPIIARQAVEATSRFVGASGPRGPPLRV